MSTNKLTKVDYLTFGSPIFDLIIDVDQDFIKDFGLKLDTTSHSNKNDRIFDQIELISPMKVPGGCSYNAIRVLNWMLNKSGKQSKGKVGCLGAVGNDSYGEIYTALLNNEKIVPLLEVFKGLNTAKCATICEGRERCHITDLGVSTLISDSYIDQIWDNIKDLTLVYTELYILCHKESILKKLANLCLEDNKLFGFNFPSMSFLETFDTEIIEMISYGDVLFANKEEAKHFVGKVLKKEYNTMEELVEILVKLPKKNTKKSRVFVVTCGPEPAYVAKYNHSLDTMEYLNSHMPFSVKIEDIIDTNAAGDSFAGGFLSYYVQGFKMESCIRAGHWAAKEIIKVRGCNIPSEIETPDELDLYDSSLKTNGDKSSAVEGESTNLNTNLEQNEILNNQNDQIILSKNEN